MTDTSMFKLKKGANKVQLSLTSSFTPILEFATPYTGNIKLCKKHTNGTLKETIIKIKKDKIIDLGTYREYFTEYKDDFTQLVITVNTRATLKYESTIGETLDFGLEENPDYTPPEPEAQKCPICQQDVSVSDIMTHIQNNHM